MTKKKILVADDDPAICEGITLILEDAGYEVTTTTDGRTLKKIQQTYPDLILLDIWMSGVDGRDICAQLKKQKVTKQIPVLMISANRDTREIAQQAGADGYIAKPFEMQHLLDQVARFTK